MTTVIMAKIFIFDEFSPEDTAMMQALYSRSSQSAIQHAEKVRASGSGKFMERFYVGYGHKSIADCGSTTIFIEGVSMLTAKAIQDWPMYSGQETSSRYIDFSLQPLVDPLNTETSRKILEKWIAFYTASVPKVKAYLQTKYPKSEEEKDEVYARAANAWSFDVMRGFLPAGVTTQLSWHTNLRQAWDKLSWLMFHPLEEVRTIAKEIFSQLQEKYAHSFGFDLTEEQERYISQAMEIQSYVSPEYLQDTDFEFSTTINPKDVEQYTDLLSHRPKYTGLPYIMKELGDVTFQCTLDFGSFRDLQRHRNGVCLMPLLTARLGFHEWYLNELPEDVREDAILLLKEQNDTIESLSCDEKTAQYFLPMGYNVRTRVTYGLPASVYVTELRSGRTVHPTLRRVAHKMHEAMKKAFPTLHLYSDLSADDRDVRRGKQDIIEKK